MVRFLLAGWLCFLSGCTVDTAFPDGVLLTCTEVGQCPQGWVCDMDKQQCRGPNEPPEPDAGAPDAALADGEPADGQVSWEDEYRAQDKAEICGALYDRTMECEAEVRGALGDEGYAMFEEGREAFVTGTCVMDLMADATDTELDDTLAQLSLIALTTCSYFAGEICLMLEEVLGDLPGC